MKKIKKAMTLLLSFSVVMMSGFFVFADEEAFPQEVSETQEIQPSVDKPEDDSNKVTQTEQNSVPNYVSTMVFLRYTNEVPANILQGFAQVGFGPAGSSSSPYFTVEVDLNKIEALCEQGLIKKYVSGEYVYYSAQETLNPEQPVTKEDAISCWNAILQAVFETDKQKFTQYFGVSGVAGTPNFIGYVFKLETDGWHIDGILDVKPGYVTEFYLNGEIKNMDVASAAMPINTAKGNVEEMLEADSGTIKWNDNGMGGTYKAGSENYQFTIEEGDYSPSNESVQYETKIQDAYYLARIYVITEKIEPEPKPEPTVPPVEPVTPPVIPDPVPDPVIPPVVPDPTPIVPIDPVEPQPLPPDDPLIEEPDEPTVNPQPLPEDEHLIDPTDAKKPADPDQPKTGDEAPLMALGGLFFATAGALGVIYIRRKL